MLEGPNGPLPPQNPGERWGAKPFTFPLGLWGGRKPFGPPKAPISGPTSELLDLWVAGAPMQILRTVLSYGKGFDTGPPQAGAGSLSFSGFSGCLVVFLGAPGRLSYPPGPILGSVFLLRCLCRHKPPYLRLCNRASGPGIVDLRV
jgi:hypothetical protein